MKPTRKKIILLLLVVVVLGAMIAWGYGVFSGYFLPGFRSTIPSRPASIKNRTPLKKGRKKILPETILQKSLSKTPLPSQQKPLHNQQIRGLLPDKGISPRKKIVLDLDNLKVLKNLEKNQNEKGTVKTGKTYRLKENNFDGTYSTSGGPTKIYENGRLKIEGRAGLTEFPEKIEPLDKMKDKMKVNGNLTIDF